MALKGFRAPQQSDGPTQALAVAVKDFTRQLEKNPLMDGLILSDIVIGTTATDIQHGLGRPFRGWFIIRKNDTATVREDTTQTNEKYYLTLIASSSTTVSIYVF
jgi:hypothetical protein